MLKSYTLFVLLVFGYFNVESSLQSSFQTRAKQHAKRAHVFAFLGAAFANVAFSMF